MALDALLGNSRLKENLTASLSRGRTGHFYLISGPEGSGKHTLAQSLAAAILCKGGGLPCGKCGPCRKVLENNHPDVITVDDPEHKNVAVRIIRQMREDVFILPNESDHKIYILPQEMGIEGQNALLKILEEPPKYGVFLILTDNPEKLLPTVRSRCIELKLQALDEKTMTRALGEEFPSASAADLRAAYQRSGGYLGQAKKLLAEGEELPPQTEGFVRSFAARDALGLVQTLVPMEKWKRDQLVPILGSWAQLIEQALVCRSGLDSPSLLARTLAECRTSRDLMEAAAALKKAREYAQGNVSTAAICGWLEWALR